MCAAERADLRADVERLHNFDAPCVQDLAQSFAVDKLSGNKVRWSRLSDLVDGENIWVIQS